LGKGRTERTLKRTDGRKRVRSKLVGSTPGKERRKIKQVLPGLAWGTFRKGARRLEKTGDGAIQITNDGIGKMGGIKRPLWGVDQEAIKRERRGPQKWKEEEDTGYRGGERRN